MQRRTLAIATLLALSGATAHAQQDLLALLNLQQDAMIERLVTDLAAQSVERQRYALYSLETLLAPAGAEGPMLGVEQAAGLGLLARLDALTATGSHELAGDAAQLRSLVETRLDVAAAGFAAPLPALGDNGRHGALTLGDWYALDVVAGQEYAVDTRDCPLAGVVALDADGREGVGGGLATDGRFAFVPAATGTVLLRAAAVDCDGAFVLSRMAPPVALPRDTSIEAPAVIAAGQRYSGEFAAGRDQWLRVDLAAGSRYRFDLEPAAGVDSVMTIFASDGRSELAQDDDSGTGLGSRIDLVPESAGPVLVRASELSGSAGEFRLLVSELQSPLAAARPIRLGERIETRFDTSGEDWWRLEIAAGTSVEIAAAPERGADTLLAVFAADGTTLLAENDDYGGDLGSRLTLAGDGTPRLIRVTEFDGAGGGYALTVSEWSIAGLDPRDPAIGRSERGSLGPGRADWWRLAVEPGARYQIDVAPADGIDTMITLYDATGANELGADDDGGNGLGSRLDFTGSTDGPYLLRVEELSGEPGRYTLRVDPRAHPSDTAGTVRPGRPVEATLGYGGESWWRFRADAGTRYVIEATPHASIDTQMTLFRGDGLEQIAFDDDGGNGLGSRIEYASAADETLYVLVREFSGEPGEFGLSVDAR